LAGSSGLTASCAPCCFIIAEVSRTGRGWTCPGRRSSPESRRRQSTSPALEVGAARPPAVPVAILINRRTSSLAVARPAYGSWIVMVSVPFLAATGNNNRRKRPREAMAMAPPAAVPSAWNAVRRQTTDFFNCMEASPGCVASLGEYPWRQPASPGRGRPHASVRTTTCLCRRDVFLVSPDDNVVSKSPCKL